MKVLIANRQKDLKIKRSSIKPIIEDVLHYEFFKTDEVSVHFVTTSEICRLHKEFFDDPSTTDCITFPLDGTEQSESNYHVLGEIFICPETALAYVKNDRINESAAYIETTLYLVHGLLHLLGYDDIEERERKKMRAAEKRHMERLLNKKLLLKKL